jgi:hypothetical protein
MYPESILDLKVATVARDVVKLGLTFATFHNVGQWRHYATLFDLPRLTLMLVGDVAQVYQNNCYDYKTSIHVTSCLMILQPSAMASAT